MNQSGMKRISIVDDHTIMRDGLAQLVASIDGCECCWMAGDVAGAMKLLEEEKPDLMLVDMTMPGRNGLELIKDALAVYTSLPILVVSMHDESLYAQRVLRAGAKGYIMKDAASSQLIEAIQKISNGGVWVSQEMSSKIIQAFSGDPKANKVEGVYRLTDREFEVFQMVGEGRSKSEMADSLHISPKTVDVHKAHIREKLELEDASAVLRYAMHWVEMRKM